MENIKKKQKKPMKTSIIIIATVALAALSVIGVELHESAMKNAIKQARVLYLEQGYHEGQKDALEGDIRIKLVDSCYVWTRSPWIKPRKYTFVPCK